MCVLGISILRVVWRSSLQPASSSLDSSSGTQIAVKSLAVPRHCGQHCHTIAGTFTILSATVTWAIGFNPSTRHAPVSPVLSRIESIGEVVHSGVREVAFSSMPMRCRSERIEMDCVTWGCRWFCDRSGKSKALCRAKHSPYAVRKKQTF
jgi:hypothetical protein